jgi:DNA-binding NtrC family response regulator
VRDLLLVLTVVRDAAARSSLKMVLESIGHRVIESNDDAQALLLLSNGLDPDILIAEPVSDGQTNAFEHLHSQLDFPKHRICLILGMAGQALRKKASGLGIQHFLIKPLTRGDIESALTSMNSDPAQRSRKELDLLPRHIDLPAPSANPSKPFHLEELGGNRYFLAVSPNMAEIHRIVTLIAEVNISVLILGESGTGKEVVAHLIHRLSHRSRERFVNVNCAALPSELMESELFGHCQGAFTGALRDRPGKLEQANRGTILLDEIGEISLHMQAKLLHVLQDGQFTRLGGQDSTKVDVRILAATNIDMEKALAERTFREDLYYRLNTFSIKIPPLRERREEIPYFIDEIIRRTPHLSRNGTTFRPSSRLLDAALRYDWPGNLRELRNFVTRAIVMGDQDEAIRDLERLIANSATPPTSNFPAAGQPEFSAMRSLVRDVKNRTEAHMIQDALELSGWNRRRAAEYLNISYRGLLYKIRQHSLAPRPPVYWGGRSPDRFVTPR